MPVMDGLTAARAIRNLEDHESASIPIIAITAHSMAGDAQRSIECGMNGHITKPIDPDDLYAQIALFIPEEDVRIKTIFTPMHGADSLNTKFPEIRGLDADLGLLRAGGNARLYRKLIADFVRDFGSAGATIADAYRSGTIKNIGELAHTIKGVSGTIGAGSIYDAASTLMEAISSDASDLDMRVALLEDLLNTLVIQLRDSHLDMYEKVVSKKMASTDPQTLRDRLADAIRVQDPILSKTLVLELATQISENTIGADCIDELCAQIDQYRFTEAAKALERVPSCIIQSSDGSIV